MSQHPNNLLSSSSAAIEPLALTVSGPDWDGGKRHVFEQPFVLIGRDERSCLRLEDDAVSRRHAYLQQLDGGIFCVDLDSRSGTRWGDEARPAGWLRPDCGIQIGPFTLELPDTASAGEGAAGGDPLRDRINEQLQSPRFTIAVDHEIQAQFRMNREMVLVGTSPACRVRLREAGISRFHCSLVKRPEGIWVVDLLSGTGIRLNGQPVRWARVHEGDHLRVGPYVLRLGYEGEDTTKRSTLLPEQRAETPVQKEEDKAAASIQAELDQLRERIRDMESLRNQLTERETESVQFREQVRVLEIQTAEAADLKNRLQAAETESRNQQDANLRDLENVKQQLAERETESIQLREQVRVLEIQAAEATDLKGKLEAAQAEACTLQDGHLQDTENLKQQLAEHESNCVQLREQVRLLEIQAAESADLKGRLQAAQEEATKLADACSERDRWQAETLDLRSQIASESSEREKLRQQLETAQQHLASEREAIDAANARLDQHIAALQESQAGLAARTTEHDERSQQLHETREELARVQDKASRLQAELDEVKERQKDAEALRQQLEDAGSKHDQLLVRALELEGRAASADRLQDRLRDADAEMERLREQLKAAESRFAEAESLRSECVQLREQARVSAMQAAEAADLKTRLEAAETESRNLQDASLRDLENIKQRLAERETESVQLREQVRVLEIQAAEVADLKGRLQAAQAETSKLADVSAERDHWQSEMQTLRAKIASELVEREQFDRLGADLHAVQVERDRLLTEQQESLQRAEKAAARSSELEQALAALAASHEAAITEERARWESERQALKAAIEQPRATGQESLQAAIRDLQARSAKERQEWTMRLEGAEAQIVWERGLFKEQSEQLRRQLSALQAERDRLTARLSQGPSSPMPAEVRSLERPSRPVQTTAARQLAIQDQALVQLFGMGAGQPLEPSMRPQITNKQTEPGRPRLHPPSNWTQGGDPLLLSSIEEGVEAAWTQAAAVMKRPAAPNNSPQPAGEQAPGVAPDAGAKTTGENRSAQAIPAAVCAVEGQESNPSDTTQRKPEAADREQVEEVFHAGLSQVKDEDRSGLWRKFVNMVRGK